LLSAFYFWVSVGIFDNINKVGCFPLYRCSLVHPFRLFTTLSDATGACWLRQFGRRPNRLRLSIISRADCSFALEVLAGTYSLNFHISNFDIVLCRRRHHHGLVPRPPLKRRSHFPRRHDFWRRPPGPQLIAVYFGSWAAMIFSMIVAFVITPWASLRLLKASSKHEHGVEGFTTRLYRRVMTSIITRPVYRYTFLAGVVLLLLGAVSLIFLQFVKVKMLPFDNKSEFQVVIDMPEGSTSEQTAAATRDLGSYTSAVPETWLGRSSWTRKSREVRKRAIVTSSLSSVSCRSCPVPPPRQVSIPLRCPA
jgi:hypothetical protein